MDGGGFRPPASPFGSPRCSRCRASSAGLFERTIPAELGGNLAPVRHACFGWEGLADLGHLGALVFFGVVMSRLAIWRTAARLIA